MLPWWGDEFTNDGNNDILPDMARNAGLEVENVNAQFAFTDHIWTESIIAENIVKRYTQCILDCSCHHIPIECNENIKGAYIVAFCDAFVIYIYHASVISIYN